MSEVQYFLRDPRDLDRPYRPRQHQWDFATCPAAETFLAGGWGSGKSLALSQFLAISAFRNPPETEGAVVLPTGKLLRNFIDGIIRPTWGPIVIDENKNDGILYLQGGRKLRYISGHVPQRIEAYTLCYAGVDEPGLMSSLVREKINARTRDPRATWLRKGYTGVPVWGWLRDVFDGQHTRKRYIMHCSTFDNDTLTDEGRESILSGCPAYKRQAYIYGHFVPTGSLVYQVFSENPERNLIDWEYSKYHETIAIIDPGARMPHVLLAQVLPEGAELPGVGKLLRRAAVVFDEIIVGGPDMVVTTPQLCKYIRAKGYPLVRAIADRASRGVEATSGTNTYKQLRKELGIPIQTPPESMRSVRVGVEHVNLALAPMVGHPTLFFARHLADKRDARSAIPAMRAYAYSTSEGKPVSDEPVKDGITDHAMDCIRYLVTTVLPSIMRLTGPRVRSIL